MIVLTGHEISQIQYIVPVQGSISTLERVQKILDKINSFKTIAAENEYNVDFSDEEIEFFKIMIRFLDEKQQLPISALSLIQKILNKEQENG